LFLLIPFTLIIVSAGGIVFIVWRKLPRLKELAESNITRTDADLTRTVADNSIRSQSGWLNFAYDLCPEVWEWARNIEVKKYKEKSFVKLEKFLRHLRIASLKMDRLSDSLIFKIRRKTGSNGVARIYPDSNGESKNGVNENMREKEEQDQKKNEQRLIIEIAKNPKNAALYEELGDLYSEAGEHKDAKESYEAAIELNSNSEELKKKLSQALEKSNKPDGSQD